MLLRAIIGYTKKKLFEVFFQSYAKIVIKHGFWLSGRVLDSRPRGRGFEPHQHYFVVSLSKTHLSMLSTGSTQEDPSRHN